MFISKLISLKGIDDATAHWMALTKPTVQVACPTVQGVAHSVRSGDLNEMADAVERVLLCIFFICAGSAKFVSMIGVLIASGVNRRTIC